MTAAQSAALSANWQTFGLELQQGPISCDKVFARQAELVVEIGFGMGDSLATMAQAAKGKNFIGISALH